MFSIDQVAPIQDDVEHKIMEERMRYSQVYEETEKYLAAHSTNGSNVVMLGGRIGVQLVLDRDRSTDASMFQYEIYAENPFKHANDLTNEISKALSPDGAWKDGEYLVWLKTFEGTNDPGSLGKYGIYVDTRQIITIIGITRGTVEVVRPNIVKSFDKKKEFAAIPAEIQLLDIYRVLYTPGDVDNWEQYLSDENQLFHHLRDREKIIHGRVDAGAESRDLGFEERRRITNTIMQSFIANNPNVVLLGEHALFILDNEPIKTHVLQICTTIEITELVKVLKSLPGVPEITFSERSLDIMKDPQLRRITIKTTANTGEKEIMYVYNAAFYDLLPFNTVKVASETTGGRSKSKNKPHRDAGTFMQIGNPFVVLRFLLVEIWMVRMILARGKIDEDFAKARIASMLQKVLKLRQRMSEGSSSDKTITTISDNYFGSTAEKDGMKIFQMSTEDYIGTYVSVIAHQKRTAGEKKRYPDYMPQRYYADTGGYRTLAH